MDMKQKARRCPQDWLCGMCMFGVSFLVSACVCDLCRVRLWCCPSLLSSQAHKVTLAFAVSPHTHTVTPAYAFLLIHIHKTYTDTHLYPHCHCWWLQLVGSALVLFFWSGQGLSDLCVCAVLCLSVHMHCILVPMLVCGRHLSWSCDF